jgi:hypothetical protein
MTILGDGLPTWAAGSARQLEPELPIARWPVKRLDLAGSGHPADCYSALSNAKALRKIPPFPRGYELVRFLARGIPMLTKPILAAIAERPGISARELRRVFPPEYKSRISDCVGKLVLEGAIERQKGRYRLPSPQLSAPDRHSSTPPSTIPPPSLARLMAGR